MWDLVVFSCFPVDTSTILWQLTAKLAFPDKSIAEKSAWAVHSWDGAGGLQALWNSQGVEGRNGVVNLRFWTEPGKAILGKLVSGPWVALQSFNTLRAANDTGKSHPAVRKNSADYTKFTGQRSVIVGARFGSK